MRVSHILVKHLHEAEDLLRQLDSGKSFESLARRYSVCPSAELGGWLGDVSKRKVDPQFAEALKNLKVGQISAPIRTSFGYHLIRKEDD